MTTEEGMKITCIKAPASSQSQWKYVIVYGWSAWPARTLVHRGWHRYLTVYVRPATPDEIEEQHISKRYLAYRYHSWQELAEDEAKYGIDADALRVQFAS